MNTLLQKTFDELSALPDDQQNRLAEYLQTHKQEILDFPVKDEFRHPKKKLDPKDDPWANPEIPIKTVETGITDLAVNHDHYLYGTSKKYPNG